jgi:hypothetical protein
LVHVIKDEAAAGKEGGKGDSKGNCRAEQPNRYLIISLLLSTGDVDDAGEREREREREREIERESERNRDIYV